MRHPVGKSRLWTFEHEHWRAGRPILTGPKTIEKRGAEHPWRLQDHSVDQWARGQGAKGQPRWDKPVSSCWAAAVVLASPSNARVP